MTQPNNSDGGRYGFVSTEAIDRYEGCKARVPPLGETMEAIIGRLEDHGDTFSVGDSTFRKDECAYVAVEGVECQDDRPSQACVSPNCVR